MKNSGSTPSRPAPGEEVGQPRLALREHADPEPVALVEQAAHPAAAVERDEHERRAQRDGHEGVRGHPVHLVADARGQDRDAGREHPERAPEGDRRDRCRDRRRRSRSRDRDVVEGGVAEALERAGREPPGSSSSNSRGGGASLLMTSIVPTGGAPRAGPRRSRVLALGDGSGDGRRLPSRASSACPHASGSAPCPGRSGGRRRAASRSTSTPTPITFSFVPP